MSPKKTSPTARSLKHAREKLGWHVDVVERWIPRVNIRKDLFGVIDLVAIAGSQIVGIQATTGAHHAHRREKALAEPRLRAWLAAGGGFEVWSWEKQGPVGKRKVWMIRRERIELKNLPTAVAGTMQVEAA